MWPFDNNDETDKESVTGEVDIEAVGCTAHHFPEPTPTDEYRLDQTVVVAENGKLYEADRHVPNVGDYPWSYVAKVERKLVKKCEHEGCTERRESWETASYLHPDDMDDIGHSETEFIDLIESDG